jgi:Tol biopolymer transport system component
MRNETEKATLVVAIALVGAFGACRRDDEPRMTAATAISPTGTEVSSFAFSHDGGRIAFWRRGIGTQPIWELWVAKADFSQPVKLPMIMPVSSYNPEPVWSPDDKQVAAASSLYGGTSVAVAPSAGGESRRVTHGTGLELPTSWHADNDHLHYVSFLANGKWAGYVVSTRSGKTVRAVPGESRPHIVIPSPDGRHVVMQISDGGRETIWVADSAGRNQRQLTVEGTESFDASRRPWSPDGTALVYTSRRTGKGDIWVVPVDGGTPRQLTRDIAGDSRPQWSPDGKWIAFLSDRGKQTDVWIVPSAGGQEVRLTDSNAQEWNIRWRPGTTLLAFNEDQPNTGIWSIAAATGATRRVTPDSAGTNVSELAATVNGSSLAYVMRHSSHIDDIVVSALDGSSARKVLVGGGNVYNAMLSPDGSRISFSSNRGGSDDVWVLDVSTGSLRRMTDWPGWEGTPTWNADGSSLWFLAERGALDTDVWKVSLDGGEPVRVTKSGAFNGLIGRIGVNVLFANVRSSGRWSLALVKPDGNLKPVWDSSSSYLASISPTGDSIAAVVQTPGGHQESRILSALTARGRKILEEDEYAGAWSNDGKRLLYNFSAGGTRHLGILSLVDGSKRQLTKGSDYDDDAYSALWAPDDKTVVFLRSKPNARVFTVDASKLLGSNPRSK